VSRTTSFPDLVGRGKSAIWGTGVVCHGQRPFQILWVGVNLRSGARQVGNGLRVSCSWSAGIVKPEPEFTEFGQTRPYEILRFRRRIRTDTHRSDIRDLYGKALRKREPENPGTSSLPEAVFSPKPRYHPASLFLKLLSKPNKTH